MTMKTINKQGAGKTCQQDPATESFPHHLEAYDLRMVSELATLPRENPHPWAQSIFESDSPSYGGTVRRSVIDRFTRAGLPASALQ